MSDQRRICNGQTVDSAASSTATRRLSVDRKLAGGVPERSRSRCCVTPLPTPNEPPANAVTVASSKNVAAGEVPHHDPARVCGHMQAQRNFRRAPPHHRKADPEDGETTCSPPLAVDDDVLDREEGGRHGNAETWLNQTAPGELLNRPDHAGER